MKLLLPGLVSRRLVGVASHVAHLVVLFGESGLLRASVGPAPEEEKEDCDQDREESDADADPGCGTRGQSA